VQKTDPQRVPKKPPLKGTVYPKGKNKQEAPRRTWGGPKQEQRSLMPPDWVLKRQPKAKGWQGGKVPNRVPKGKQLRR